MLSIFVCKAFNFHTIHVDAFSTINPYHQHIKMLYSSTLGNSQTVFHSFLCHQNDKISSVIRTKSCFQCYAPCSTLLHFNLQILAFDFLSRQSILLLFVWKGQDYIESYLSSCLKSHAAPMVSENTQHPATFRFQSKLI